MDFVRCCFAASLTMSTVSARSFLACPLLLPLQVHRNNCPLLFLEPSTALAFPHPLRALSFLPFASLSLFISRSHLLLPPYLLASSPPGPAWPTPCGPLLFLPFFVVLLLSFLTLFISLVSPQVVLAHPPTIVVYPPTPHQNPHPLA